MDTISTWGFDFDGATLTIYPQGTDQPWNSRGVAVPAVDSDVLTNELLALSADRYADTPTLDRLIA